MKHSTLFLLAALAVVSGFTAYCYLADGPLHLVVVGPLTAWCMGTFLFIAFLSSRDEAVDRQKAMKRTQVEEEGLEAKVRVHEVRAASSASKRMSNPLLSIDVTLQVVGREDQRMTLSYEVSFLVASRIDRGLVYHAKVDPTDGTNILVPAWEPNELSSADEVSPSKF